MEPSRGVDGRATGCRAERDATSRDFPRNSVQRFSINARQGCVDETPGITNHRGYDTPRHDFPSFPKGFSSPEFIASPANLPVEKWKSLGIRLFRGDRD